MAFVVRIWIEPREIEDGSVIWRGVVEAIGSQAWESVAVQPDGLPLCRAFGYLDDLGIFMIRHLERLGIPAEQLQFTR